MVCKIGKSLAEIENFIKEKYIQEMVLLRISTETIESRGDVSTRLNSLGFFPFN